MCSSCLKIPAHPGAATDQIWTNRDLDILGESNGSREIATAKWGIQWMMRSALSPPTPASSINSLATGTLGHLP
jgi:hypothetical protein